MMVDRDHATPARALSSLPLDPRPGFATRPLGNSADGKADARMRLRQPKLDPRLAVTLLLVAHYSIVNAFLRFLRGKETGPCARCDSNTAEIISTVIRAS